MTGHSEAGTMTSAASRARLARLVAGSPARELAAILLLGALGAGLVFLASRASWAHVRSIPPRPLPASNVAVSGAQLIPFAGALVLAGLATLGAVLATRGALRRGAGVLLTAIGASLAATAFTVSTASAISAAAAGLGPAAASAGSVMDGSNPTAAAVPNVVGTIPTVSFSAGGWQAMVVAGALAMMCAGVLVVWRARRLAVMSSRYDSPAGTTGSAAAAHGHGGDVRTGRESTADAASMWEALSRGQDPTAGSTSTGF
ncbi:MAG TPA: Trp biosynthesis-associated membrane protein [Streptosporangiaceae bacterium]|jgi:uncharacterized membrane protein (TIGR02234 family)